MYRALFSEPPKAAVAALGGVRRRSRFVKKQLSNIPLVNERQVTFGSCLGLELAGSTVRVAAARIEDSLHSVFYGETLGSASPKQISFAAEFGYDLAPLRAASPTRLSPMFWSSSITTRSLRRDWLQASLSPTSMTSTRRGMLSRPFIPTSSTSRVATERELMREAFEESTATPSRLTHPFSSLASPRPAAPDNAPLHTADYSPAMLNFGTRESIMGWRSPRMKCERGQRSKGSPIRARGHHVLTRPG